MTSSGEFSSTDEDEDDDWDEDDDYDYEDGRRDTSLEEVDPYELVEL